MENVFKFFRLMLCETFGLIVAIILFPMGIIEGYRNGPIYSVWPKGSILYYRDCCRQCLSMRLYYEIMNPIRYFVFRAISKEEYEFFKNTVLM